MECWCVEEVFPLQQVSLGLVKWPVRHIVVSMGQNVYLVGTSNKHLMVALTKHAFLSETCTQRHSGKERLVPLCCPALYCEMMEIQWCFRPDPFPSHCRVADMAEYSQAGLLAALLLFTALTVRDIYLGRSSLQRGQQPAERPGLSPETLSDISPGKPIKSSLYTGPVLKFQYWWVCAVASC